MAHFYCVAPFGLPVVLENSEEHELYLRKCKKRSTWSKGKNQRDDFIRWFETRAMNDDAHDWVLSDDGKKESALLDAETDVQNALAKASMVDDLQNKNQEPIKQIEICQASTITHNDSIILPNES
ncbi:Microtubule-associated protein 70-4 [Platanthera zijinensis]|uniref:Microtubule-associated protein 70-4 n=1 Tax=Platanthera zijinensis TaxID=2320716 RepID=A0AAP0G4L0_9ASPA